MKQKMRGDIFYKFKRMCAKVNCEQSYIIHVYSTGYVSEMVSLRSEIYGGLIVQNREIQAKPHFSGIQFPRCQRKHMQNQTAVALVE